MTHDNTETVTLSRRQLGLLNDAAMTSDPTVIDGDLARAIDRLDDEDVDRLRGANLPTVVDRVDVSVDAVHDALEAMRSVDDPVVVERSEAESIDSAREALASALVITRRVGQETASRMSLDALAAEFEDLDDPRLSPAVTALSQMPETGSVREDELEDDALDLTLADQSDIADRLQFARTIESRIPDRAAAVRDELAEEYGVDDVADLEAEVAR